MGAADRRGRLVGAGRVLSGAALSVLSRRLAIHLRTQPLADPIHPDHSGRRFLRSDLSGW